MKKYLLLLLVSITGFSQTLDPSFDNDGILKTQNSNSPSTQMAYDAALQADGKLIFVGQISYPGNSGFIARYNTDGTKDLSFGQYGINTNPYYLQTVCMQGDGKIVAAGRYRIHRYLADGNEDLSFNTTGYNQVLYNNKYMNIKDVSIQTDSKIVASGYISNGSNYDFAVVRLNNNGTFDTSFDGDGILILPMGPGNDEAFSHKIQNDGKIIIAGESHNGTDYDFAICRLNNNGTLDNTFGIQGKTTTSLGSRNDYGRTIELLADGKILHLGSSAGKFALTRYDINGNLDQTFDTDGIYILNQNITLTTTLNTFNLHQIPSLQILTNGKIVLSGTSNNDYKVIQLLANGNYDSTFNTGGVATTNDSTDIATFLLKKPDNTLVVGGYSYTPALLDYRIRQFELNLNGNPVSGTVKNFHTAYSAGNAVTTQPSDQSIFVTSKAYINFEEKLVLSKYSSNGALDTSFGVAGLAIIDNFDTRTKKILFLPDNKIIIANYSSIFKLLPNGTLDSSFGNGGKLDLSLIGNGELQYIDDLTLSNDSKILVASDYYISRMGGWDIKTAVVKINVNGTRDSTFGNAGITYYGFANDPANYYNEYPRSILQEPNGNIVLTSASYNNQTQGNSSNKLYISRLTSNGVLDNSFGTNGISSYFHTLNQEESIICKTPDNKYLIHFLELPTYNSYTIKVNNNGGIDQTFGTNGVANDINGAKNNSMTIQPDGKFFKAGTNNNQFSLSRYNTNGTADMSFGLNGEINTPINITSTCQAMTLQPDGKPFLVGASFDYTQTTTTLARYTSSNLGTLNLSEKNALLIYPNPIQSDATFEYTLENSETVTIDVLDLQGRIVKKIITNERQEPGKHFLHFNLGTDSSSGNYFLTLSTAKGSQSIQIIKK